MKITQKSHLSQMNHQHDYRLKEWQSIEDLSTWCRAGRAPGKYWFLTFFYSRISQSWQTINSCTCPPHLPTTLQSNRAPVHVPASLIFYGNTDVCYTFIHLHYRMRIYKVSVISTTNSGFVTSCWSFLSENSMMLTGWLFWSCLVVWTFRRDGLFPTLKRRGTTIGVQFTT